MYTNIKKNFFLYINKKSVIFYFFIFLFSIFFSLIVYKISIYKKNYQLKKEFESIINEIKINKFNSLMYIKKFLKKNHNIYGTLIGLNLAKIYDSQKKYSCASKVLFNILNFTKDKSLSDLIKFRISIIYLKQNKIILAKNMQNSINQLVWKKILNRYKYLF